MDVMYIPNTPVWARGDNSKLPVHQLNGYIIKRNYQACDWKKIIKLTAEHKKAYFSDIAHKKR